MYCSSCGVAIRQGLSYCNHCGAKLGRAKADNPFESSEGKSESLVFFMIAAFVFGLAAIMGLMTVMKLVLGLNLELILAFTVLSFLILLTIEGVLIRLLLHRKRSAEEAGATAPSKGQPTKELDAGQARVLPEPVPSVTEDTTRPFEPIYNERTSK